MGQLETALEDILIKNIVKTDNSEYKDKIRPILEELRTKCFGVRVNEYKGVGFDKNADILHDMHQVIRHFNYKQRGETQKLTIDAYPAIKFGSEPLIKITK